MNQLKTAVLLAALAGLFIAIGHLFGGLQGAAVALVIALVMNAATYWWSDRLVLAMTRAQPVEPDDARGLYAMVERCARNAGIPTPRVYIVPDPTPNAFATGRSPQHAAVAVNEGLLRILSADEVEGVIAHEVAHIKNRDTLISCVAATVAAAITWVAHLAQFMAYSASYHGSSDREEEHGHAGNPLALLVLALLAPIAAAIIQMAISRGREYLADATGAQLCGRPLSLANALRKLHQSVVHAPADVNPATAHLYIVNPLLGGGLANLFSTHPPMEERIARLEAMAGVGVSR